ncbi:MAG: 16S rRNA (guanine(966)-N(2))-methyltransferase RsmD [Roseofilum sp. SBFL]|nr:16S rRNA (guanine(966)-N(2))-methyltransferase RsmD [Roseofilum sp. SID3]MBP0022703.1 16S rRNA (guanine(966)-N(2))-methyltransferase RsmD [Roseofilum sp. SID2]MBP0037143.1 16S rRNA (guanine(966)-N(2))-methyltransferase RsmD [Roseofilum sp. SID1]MBP0042161.1 16S rRNA (guanine(966)-N(2))-methyltransferase RsmD [Roseofilum sp. SBFL]
MLMRIYGNRVIKTLPGSLTRPTVGRVREAVCNIWQGSIAGCRWLDLCAGSGSMGAEALCRGASWVVGIEQSSRACGVIRQNWQQMASPDQFQVLCGDVLKRVQRLEAESFDRIYFDPPYQSSLYQPVLEAIADLHLLCDTGELAVEHSPQLPPPDELDGLEILRQKVYGNSAVTFYGASR